MTRTLTRILLVLLCLPQVLLGQITLDVNDMPSTGDAVLVGRYNLTNGFVVPFDYTSTDTNKTWDFSTLDPQRQDTLKVQNFITTPYGLLFLNPSNFFGTIASKQPDINLGITGVFNLVTLDNVYDYYSKSTSGFQIIGRGQTANGTLPLLAVYQQKDQVFNFPAQYGQSWVSNFGYVLTLGTGDSVVVSGTRTSTIDGWGTVKLLLGDFPCLRIKSKIETTYDVRLTSVQLPVPISVTTTENEYKWMGKNQKLPLLVVRDFQLGTAALTVITDVYFQDVFRGPTANFAYAGGYDVCRPYFTTFQDQTVSIPPHTVLWEFGDSTTDTQPNTSHTYNTGGRYTVKLTATNKYRTSTKTLQQPIVVDSLTVSNLLANPNFTQGEFGFDGVVNQANTAGTKYTWNFGDGYYSNTANPTHTYRNAGSYNVKLVVTNAKGCSDSVSVPVIVNFTTGVDDLTDAPLSVYPNPAHDVIRISGKLTSASPLQIRLFDLQGKALLQDEQVLPAGSLKLELPRPSGIINGLYLLELNLGGRRYTQRLVLE
jgi:PKD repeat protein